jgi:small subunit ribosomal protein S17
MTEQATTQATAIQKSLVGEVVSDKMAKTIVVEVGRQFRHAQYGKVVRAYKKYYAHDEQREAAVGDRVRIVATRPLSRLKRWRLAEIVTKAELVEKVQA